MESMAKSLTDVVLPNFHSCGLARLGADSRTIRPYQTGYHVALILKGTMWIELRDRRYVAAPGDLAWFDLGQPYTYGTQESPLHRYWMRVSGTGVDRLFHAAGVDHVCCVPCAHDARAEIERLFATLCEVTQPRSRVALTRARRIAGDLIDKVYPEFSPRGEFPRVERIGIPIDRRVRHSMQFIELNACKDVTLDEIAAKVNLSKYYFTRLFKTETGMSPKQYLLECRLIQVRKLLIRTDLTIGEIAEACGFRSQSYLTRFFQKAEGVTPSDFRHVNRRG